MPPDAAPEPDRSFTVLEVANRYRVSPDKVRAWIGLGELAAVNVAGSLSGRAQLRVPPEALVAFERARRAGTPPAPRRRKKRISQVDYFPGD